MSLHNNRHGIVTRLSDGKGEAKIGAVILLRTFLRPGYEQFYGQTFDLAVANLRFQRTTTHPLADPVPEEEREDEDLQSYEDLEDEDLEVYGEPNAPLPLTTLSHALIVIFKEAFPRARDSLKKQEGTFRPAFLDASRIQLDNAYLAEADLSQAWMPQVFLRKANLSNANLSGMNLSRASLMWANLSYANLSHANLSGTQLYQANLSHADLSRANLSDALLNNTDLSHATLSYANLTEASLRDADLSGAKLDNAKLSKIQFGSSNFSDADLSNANLSGAEFSEVSFVGANLSNADLSNIKVFVPTQQHSRRTLKTYFDEANLSGANLSGAILHQTDFSDTNLSGANLSGVTFTQTNLEEARSLEDTNLCGVKGLTKEQLKAYQAKGAIIDEDLTASSPQSTTSSSASRQVRSRFWTIICEKRNLLHETLRGRSMANLVTSGW